MGVQDTIILLNRPEKHFLESFYFQKIKQGIDIALDGRRYQILMSQQSSRLPDILGSESIRMTGVLDIAPHVNHDSVRLLEKAGIPCVLINCRSERLSWVDSDNALGAVAMTEHLLNLGHEKILFLSGFPESQNSIDRYAGYRLALEKHGLACDPELVLSCDFSITVSYEKMKEYLDRRPRPEFTAVFASNDLMAVGAIRALTDFDISVPRDVAVVGYDDFDFAATYSLPLTTYKQPFLNVGYLATKYLLRQIESRVDQPQRGELVGEPVIRSSCGAG